MLRTMACPYFRKAFGYSVPIGGLAGLIGLGGGEFRLPVLIHAIGFDARSAIPLNLTISLVTLAFAMMTRSGVVALDQLIPFLPAILGLVMGGMASAFYGAALVRRLSMDGLVRLIACLLAGLGGLLLWESLFPFQQASLASAGAEVHFAAALVLGVGIGLVSSVLGVAGGELLIPTLMFVFGADIKTAGSASILISLVIVTMGLWRYWRMGAIPRGRGVQRLTLAMSSGSILGAVVGGCSRGRRSRGGLEARPWRRPDRRGRENLRGASILRTRRRGGAPPRRATAIQDVPGRGRHLTAQPARYSCDLKVRCATDCGLPARRRMLPQVCL